MTFMIDPLESIIQPVLFTEDEANTELERLLSRGIEAVKHGNRSDGMYTIQVTKFNY